MRSQAWWGLDKKVQIGLLGFACLCLYHIGICALAGNVGFVDCTNRLAWFCLLVPMLSVACAEFAWPVMWFLIVDDPVGSVNGFISGAGV